MTDPLPDARSAGTQLSWRLTTVVFLAVIAFLVALERRFPLRFDSDDVAWQIALRDWRPGQSTLVLPENTYLLHIPLLVLGDRLLPSGPNSLLVVSWLLNLIGLVLIVWVADRVVAATLDTTPDHLDWATRAVTLASVAVAVLASPDQRLVMSGLTSRNLEIGLGLVIIHRVTTVWRDRVALPRSDIAIGVAALAFIGLDDPLLLYSIVVPTIIVGLIALVVPVMRRGRDVTDGATRACALSITLVGTLGIAAWQLLRLIIGALDVRQSDAGVDLVGPVEALAHVDELTEVWGMISGVDRIGNGHWYQVATGIGVAVLVVAMVVVLIRSRSWPPEVWAILAWPVVLSALYVATTAGSDPELVRYVAVGYPAIGVVLAATASRERLLRLAVVGFALFTLIVAGTTVFSRRGTEGNGTYQIALALEQFSEESGTSLGFSGYWTAHIVTYYAGDPPTVLAENCGPDGRSQPFEWITDLGRFDPDESSTSPSTSSFIIVDTSPRALACPPDLLRAEHGEPTRIVDVDEATEIWLYDRDVTADLTPDLTSDR
jgi:hypothetical protein